MTSPDPYYTPVRRGVGGQLAVELLALVVFVAGLAGLAYAAFAQDRELGIAVLSAYAIAAGVALGVNR